MWAPGVDQRPFVTLDVTIQFAQHSRFRRSDHLVAIKLVFFNGLFRKFVLPVTHFGSQNLAAEFFFNFWLVKILDAG
ncbi:hypothetical protein D3C71_1654790 [compost metagenome]